MMLEFLGLGVGSFTQSVASAAPENTGKKCNGGMWLRLEEQDFKVMPRIYKEL